MNPNPHPASESAEPLENSIRLRAYYLWLDRGSPEGSDWEDWFTAEGQFLTEQTPATTGNAPRTETASPHFSIKDTVAAHLSDPTHRFHQPGTAHDNRTTVVEGEARQRVRARHFGGSRQAQRREGK